MSPGAAAGTRAAFIEGLMEAAVDDPRIVLVCADSAAALGAAPFAARFPDRFFDVGIAEQNAVAFAAGMAASGLRPFFGGYAGFITMRACEQVRTFAACPGLDVKFAGMNGGVHGGEREGVTHQAVEDLAIMRAVPGMEIVVPADAGQAKMATRAIAARPGPAYLRLGNGHEPAVFDLSFGFEFGRARVLEARGGDAALFCNGTLVRRVLRAAEMLAGDGIRTTVVEVHTLKPLDVETIAGVLARAGAAVSIEDHNIIGGLGSAVAEVMAERGLPLRLARLGIRDLFPSSGDGESLLDFHGMRVADIAGAVKAARKAGYQAPRGETA